jgi:hypothetical protein
MNSAIVKIYVGTEKTPWILHENVLCQYSNFFRKAFQGKFLEASKKTMTLEEDDPVVFGHLIEWMYTGHLVCNRPHKTEDWNHLLDWCRLEILADKLGLSELQKAAITQFKKCDEMDEFDKNCTQIEVIEFIYGHYDEGSAFRERMVDNALWSFLYPTFKHFRYWVRAQSCNISFAEDVATALKAHLNVGNPDDCELQKCSIHRASALRKPLSKKRRIKPVGDKKEISERISINF